MEQLDELNLLYRANLSFFFFLVFGGNNVFMVLLIKGIILQDGL